MARVFKYVGIGLGGVLLLMLLALGYFLMGLPRMRPAPEQLERTEARVERGRYLVEHVANCFMCHAERDWSMFGAPIVTRGARAPRYEMAPGTVYPANITPDPRTGLGQWTDGEIMRAIREGVDRRGRTLLPMAMPWNEYREMSDEDVRSIVAYLRTLPPVEWERPATEVPFFLDLLFRIGPSPMKQPVSTPARADPVAYGRYLVDMAQCAVCHSAGGDGELPEGTIFAGGAQGIFPQSEAVSANITPDLETGIGHYTEDAFVARFKAYAHPLDIPAVPGTVSSMPWLAFAGMEEDDLRAIYRYLRTVKPVNHRVVVFPKAPAPPSRAIAD